MRALRLFIALLLLGGPAAAQPAPAWQPDRPARIIVGYPAGVGPDVVARLLAQGLQARLGSPVVVENRPGGGGTVGADAVAKAPPDGSVLGAIPAAPLALNPHLMGRLPFDPVQDFTPLAEFAAFASAVVAAPMVPARTLEELVAWLRTQDGAATCSGATVGSMLHVGMAMLLRAWTVQCPLAHSGGRPSLPEVLSGRLVAGIENIALAAGPARAGSLRLLAVTTPARLPDWPEVPAVAESVPGFEAVSWIALLGPRGLPEPVAARLEAAARAVAEDSDTLRRLAAMGAVPLPGGRAALAERIAAENRRWGAVIRESNIRVE